LRTALLAWFSDAKNGIQKFFAGEIDTKKICISDDADVQTCITKAQLDRLLAGGGTTGQTVIVSNPVVTTDSSDTAVVDTSSSSLTDENSTETDIVSGENMQTDASTSDSSSTDAAGSAPVQDQATPVGDEAATSSQDTTEQTAPPAADVSPADTTATDIQ
jgi:hypothetical protein